MSEMKPPQRRLALHRKLVKRGKVIASHLARDWRCSERTVRRDLAAMRDVDGLPLEYDPINETWRYTKEVAELPAMLIENEDRRALLFSLQSAAQFEDTPVCDEIRRVYSSLLATLTPESATQFERMMKSVRFVGPQTPPIARKTWDLTLLCLEAGETMRITYTDGYHNHTSEREIDPYGLIMRDRWWRLIAYCHSTEEVRAFSMHRIHDASSTDRAFKTPPSFMDEYLAGSLDGFQTTGRKVRVRLRIAKDAPPFVLERQWRPEEIRSKDKDGNTIIEFHTAATFALEQQVRAEGGHVAILEPTESRNNMRQCAKALAAAHR